MCKMYKNALAKTGDGVEGFRVHVHVRKTVSGLFEG